MIKINLLDSGARRVKKTSPLAKLPVTTIGCGLILTLALLACGWRYMSVVWDNQKLDRDIVLSESFAKASGKHFPSLGRHELRDITGDQQVFCIAEDG